MKLAEMTWPEVEALDRRTVVLIPTGSLEQHGAHLPLLTDTLLVTAVAEAAEKALSKEVLLVPTIWLGASQHHLAFAGSLSASFAGYHESLLAVVECMIRHQFQTFYVLNGHGGNSEPNGVACRELKHRYPEIVIGHAGYYQPIAAEVAAVMDSQHKEIRHACEAETSLMMHVRPDLIRTDRLRNDGLSTQPPVPGMVWTFEEMTEMGSYGEATLASPAKGKVMFEAAVTKAIAHLKALHEGLTLVG